MMCHLLLQVDSEWAAGCHEEAYKASRMARSLNLIALLGDVVVWVVFILIIVSVNAAA